MPQDILLSARRSDSDPSYGATMLNKLLLFANFSGKSTKLINPRDVAIVRAVVSRNGRVAARDGLGGSSSRALA